MSAGGTTCLNNGMSLVDFHVNNWQVGILIHRWRTEQIDNLGNLHQDKTMLPPLTWQTVPLEITNLSAVGTPSPLRAHALYALF